jgi:hypothetical protein
MENIIVAFIAVTAMGFGVTIFFVSKLFKEQRQINDNLTASVKALADIKTQLEKIEAVGKEHKAVSKDGLAQVENALKETVKLG